MADLETLVQWYEDAIESTTEARRLSERDRDYYDNKQWTPAEVAELGKRQQPVITSNRIKPKIDFLLGTEQKQRTDPRAVPRTPMDEDSAHAATDGIRFVCDSADFSNKRSAVFKDMCIEGIGGAIVEATKKGDKVNIEIRRIPWDRIFYDPHSREGDFSDKRYDGIVAWLDLEEAVAYYGEDKRDMLLAAINTDEGETYEDKPRFWTDRNRQRVKCIEIYYKQGLEWYCCHFTKGGFLRDPAPSPYVDEDGVPCDPIEYQSCHVDRENRRYGLVRQLVGPQDEVNKRRSKALHLLSVRQFTYEKGAVDDIRRAKRELAKPDGAVEINPGLKFELLDHNDMATGNLNLLQDAKQEIDTVGANASLTGKEGGISSGRELQARQQGGLLELGPVFDGLRMWQQRIYVQVWYRIKQFWTAEMWVRVTDDENNVKFVGLNQPMTVGEMQIKKAKQQGAPPEQLQQMVEQLAADPAAQAPGGVDNDVAKMQIDLMIEDAPDTVNIQGEEFEQLVQMYQANPQGIPWDMIVEASSLRNKKEILEKLRGSPQENADKQQKQQMVEQMTLQDQQAKTQKTQAETEQKRADTEKTRVETALAQFHAANPAPAQGNEGECAECSESASPQDVLIAIQTGQQQILEALSALAHGMTHIMGPPPDPQEQQQLTEPASAGFLLDAGRANEDAAQSGDVGG